MQFVPAPEPVIRIQGVYQLKNTGNQPLDSLELRLPGRRRFHFVDPLAEWDKANLSFGTSAENARNTLLTFPSAWKVSSSHTLRLSVEYHQAVAETNLSFTADAFFLPAEGWSPELLPARGMFATGGVPPKKWELLIEVPEGFLAHASGRVEKKQGKSSAVGRVQLLRVTQDAKSGYPFVVAGRYSGVALGSAARNVNVWTLSAQDTSALQQGGEALTRAIRAYDSMFGNRLKESSQLWIVECPVVIGCFSSTASVYDKLISPDNEKSTAEMASSDTAVVDLTGGAPQIAAAAPSLASSWLGYGRNPGFYEQEPPLSALPVFAASRGREAVEGGESRADTIRRLLRAIPEKSPSRQPETGDVLRAKSFLFFYGLQDRFGAQTFDAALRHMLDARSERGFNLDDLIASLEQESHQNAAEFVRLWMKRPGVPADFRSRYETAPAATSLTKESIP